MARLGSDETSGRLEFLLATPLDRVAGSIAGGLGIALEPRRDLRALPAVGIGLGVGSDGDEVATPVIGAARPRAVRRGPGRHRGCRRRHARRRVRGARVVIVTLATWFVDIIAPVLNLPGWVHDLALTSHYGSPMLGQWDLGGVVASLVLGVGGVLIGAWGFARRDLR